MCSSFPRPYCGARTHPIRVPVVKAIVSAARPKTSSYQLSEKVRDTLQIFLTLFHSKTQYSRLGVVRLDRLKIIFVSIPG